MAEQSVSETVSYRQVNGFPGYWIGTDGKVFSVSAGRFLKGSRDGVGYRKVYIVNGVQTRTAKVHHLVLETFVGPCPDGMECCHGNDIKHDNRLDNIRWDIKASNTNDAIRNHRYGRNRPIRGEENHKAILTATDVEQIRLLKGKEQYRTVAERFGVSVSAINHIWHNRNWKHVP